MKKIYTAVILSVLFFFCIYANATQQETGVIASHGVPVYQTVPVAYTGTPGTATFLGPLANAQRTYQLLINQDQLTELTGRNLTGLSLRIPVSATSSWPLSPAFFSNYDIYLSGSVAPAERSLTFANNIVGTQTQVRSGSLTIDTSSYPFGGSPNSFGTEISFSTPWLYTGGHLLIEIRHSGFTGTSRSVDAIGTAISGYGTQFSACWTGSYTGTSGTQGNFSVVRLTADSTVIVGVNEPGIVPAEYKLNQNYPNPFNPSTKISFGIPVSEFVTLKIYDVMGREVASLINESLKPGIYETQWNAGNNASNIYFYKLTAGNFIETKRMTLVK